MDVKSLFKSGKKSIKAFKIATGPAQDSKEEGKPSDAPLEAWEAPAAAQAAPVVNVGVDDYKAEKDQSAAKPSVQWSAEVATPEPVIEKTFSASAYVPPSQRRAEVIRSMPSLAEAVKLAAPVPAKAAVSSAPGAPSRLKLVTAASKKAAEEEEKRKEEEKRVKEAEKQARKEQLKAEMERQVSVVSSTSAVSVEIKAASLEQVYAKYVGRAKLGRKLAPSA